MALTHEERRERSAGKTWHEARFDEDPKKTRIECKECARPMWLPTSKLNMYQRCSNECRHAYRARKVANRSRPCETCGKTFTPRQAQLANGGGRYCSRACNTASNICSPENLARALARRRELIAAGMIKFARGEHHPSWKGGHEAVLRRRRESGQNGAQLRKYRAANPEKTREYTRLRRGKMVGRLPRGTISSIGERQRWRCAICQERIRSGYHVDHIVPLARGGPHEPRNLQLLCRTCNVRKGSADPIAHMQKLGRLL